MLRQQGLENGAVTPTFVCAVASHREGGVMRQGSMKIEQPRCEWTLHFSPVALDEGLARRSSLAWSATLTSASEGASSGSQTFVEVA